MSSGKRETRVLTAKTPEDRGPGEKREEEEEERGRGRKGVFIPLFGGWAPAARCSGQTAKRGSLYGTKEEDYSIGKGGPPRRAATGRQKKKTTVFSL